MRVRVNLKTFVFLFLLLISGLCIRTVFFSHRFASSLTASGAIVGDYQAVGLFSSIPDNYITSAAALNVLSRTSDVACGVGCTSVSNGLDDTFAQNSKYSRALWNFQIGSTDVTSAKITDFQNAVSANPGANVYMMSYNYDDDMADATTYINAMNTLETNNPGKKFVWWTMPLQTSPNSNRDTFNNAIRTYAVNNSKILFDLASIESYDPSGVGYTDPSGIPIMYYGYTGDGAHLNSTGYDRAAKAFWVMMAEVASWNPNPTNTPTVTNTPTNTPTGIFPTMTPTDTPTGSPTNTPTTTPISSITPTPITLNNESDFNPTTLLANGDMELSEGGSAQSSIGVTFPQQITIGYGNSSTVIIPANEVVTSTLGTTLNPSQFSAASPVISSLAGIDTSTIRGALHWGISGFGLDLATPITISIAVTGSDGQNLSIYRSLSGQDSWTTAGLTSSSCTISAGLCTFTTSKASYFIAYVAPVTQSDNNSSSGNNITHSPPICSDPAPRSAPTIYKIIRKGKTAQIHFAPAKDPLNYYYVDYSIKKDTDMYGTTFAALPSSGSMVFTVGNLNTRAKYYFRVRAGNGCMPGDWSSWVELRVGNRTNNYLIPVKSAKKK